MKHTFSIILLFFCASNLTAQTRNGLDPSFGDRGIALYSKENTYASGVAIQSDGKIVVSALVRAMRYLNDGTLDNTFGTNGTFTYSAFDTLPFFPQSGNVLLQQDGKIILCLSHSEYDYILIRLMPNGTPDSTFFLNGIFVRPNSNQYGTEGIAVLQPNGKILVSGTLASGDTSFISRVNNDGTLDTTFGLKGYAKRFLHHGRIRGMDRMTDGRIVIAGESYDANGQEIIIAQRYLQNGVPDNSFGQGGESINYLPSLSYCRAVKVQADGKIVLLGSSSNKAYLLRLKTDGSADPLSGRRVSLPLRIQAFHVLLPSFPMAGLYVVAMTMIIRISFSCG